MAINNSECPRGGAHDYVEVVNTRTKIIVQCRKCHAQSTAWK